MVENSMDAILKSMRHVLYFYSHSVSKYAIQLPFLAAARDGEEVIYITGDREGAEREFGGAGVTVVGPRDITRLNTADPMRIILDAGSMDPAEHILMEESLKGMEGGSILCTYDLSRLDPEAIHELVGLHDKMILTADDVTMVSSDSFKDSAAIGRFIRGYLDIVVLAMVTNRPMCGTDLIDVIHKDFNVLLSPGTIYPLLHELRGKGLLECEYGIKKKIYRTADSGKVQHILNEHYMASKFINGFLSSEVE